MIIRAVRLIRCWLYQLSFIETGRLYTQKYSNLPSLKAGCYFVHKTIQPPPAREEAWGWVYYAAVAIHW